VRRWLRSTAGGLPGAYWYLWTGILVNRAGGFAVLFLSLYLTGPRQLSPALAGATVGGYGIGSAAGTLLGGALADRWGRRRTLLLAHLAGAACLACLAFVHPVPVIAALIALVGVFQGMPGPAFVAAIVDLVPDPDRTRAFNLQFWAFNLGTAAASLVAGLVAEVSFGLLFTIDATTTLLTALLILFRVPETLTALPQTLPHKASGTRAALTDLIFLVFVGLTLIQAVLSTQSSTILPLSMKADGLPPGAYGLVISLGGLLIVLGQLFVPQLITGRRKGSVLSLATLFLAVGLGLVAFASALPVYLLAAVVWTVGSMLAAPPNAAVVAELAPARIRARYQAVFYLTFSLASFIAPALGGLSFQYLGSAHWLLCLALGLVASAGHLLASGPRERRVGAGTGGGRTPHRVNPADRLAPKRVHPANDADGEPPLVPVAHPAPPDALSPPGSR
jgi:MFS family permease